jgi:hypothetical protein
MAYERKRKKNTVFHNRAPTLAYILSQPHSYLINPTIYSFYFYLFDFNVFFPHE